MRRLLSLLLFCLLALPLAAVAETAAGPVLQSVQAEFTQEKHLKILIRPIIASGMFAFQAPGSLRWEYRTPLHSVLLMHQGKIAKMIEHDGRFEPDNGAGVDAMQVVLADLGSWLDGRFEDNPLFTVSRPQGSMVLLTPKEAGLRSIISRIELYPGAQAGVMERVVIVEGPDAYTQLDFTRAVLNQDIPEATFTQP